MEYLCFGVAPTVVTYQGNSEFPATIIQTEVIKSGTVEQRLEFEFEWSPSGTLTLERHRSYLDDEWTGTEVSYVTILGDDETIAESHVFTRYLEEDGPTESGEHPQSFFTDQRIERAHTAWFWSPEGRLLRKEVRAGIAEIVARESDYVWSEQGLENVTSTRLVEDPNEEQPGCVKPDPNHIRCTAQLSYDEHGALVSFVEAGNEFAVSDNCCGMCMAE